MAFSEEQGEGDACVIRVQPTRASCGFTGSSLCDFLLDFSDRVWEPEDVAGALPNLTSNDNNAYNGIAPWSRPKMADKSASASASASTVSCRSSTSSCSKDRRFRPKSSSLRPAQDSSRCSTSRQWNVTSATRKSRDYVDPGVADYSNASFRFQHCDEASNYIKHYRQYNTAGFVGGERHLVLGHDVPDPYIAKLRYYG